MVGGECRGGGGEGGGGDEDDEGGDEEGESHESANFGDLERVGFVINSLNTGMGPGWGGDEGENEIEEFVGERGEG